MSGSPLRSHARPAQETRYRKPNGPCGPCPRTALRGSGRSASASDPHISTDPLIGLEDPLIGFCGPHADPAGGYLATGCCGRWRQQIRGFEINASKKNAMGVAWRRVRGPVDSLSSDYESGGQEFESLRARQHLALAVGNLLEILLEMLFSRCVLLRLPVCNSLPSHSPRRLDRSHDVVFAGRVDVGVLSVLGDVRQVDPRLLCLSRTAMSCVHAPH